MRLAALRINNFRRLRDVRIDLDPDTSLFVGANNSGKTSATHIFQLFIGKSKGDFQIYDFAGGCWPDFDASKADGDESSAALPQIALDLWFDVDDPNLHRVVDLLPNLGWNHQWVGVRLTYEPRDPGSLADNYAEAREKSKVPDGAAPSAYKPWPESLWDYLRKRLQREYEIKYWVLDRTDFDDDLRPVEGHRPFPLGTSDSGASKAIDRLLRVDFISAQRYLSDTESRTRSEDLSKRLSRFYERNLDQLDEDFEALAAIAEFEARLNQHFASAFQPMLNNLAELGYPGLANPRLMIKASFNGQSILNTSAQVHYALDGEIEDDTEPTTLPDQYNGLGFKNLIYMVVDVLDAHQSWESTKGERPPVHLIMIEEPESHLHAQLQQVFIRQIGKIVPEVDGLFSTQIIVTTHSAHVMYERKFQSIRYFSRTRPSAAAPQSDVKNLSNLLGGQENETTWFLQQYLRLTHCDLFFADAAILVEGNVERLLVPLIIARSVEELQAAHLTILEVGGAFAYRFRELLDFLDLPALVITDLDSVTPTHPRAACIAEHSGAVTSNQTLKAWIPKREVITDLLDLAPEEKLYRRDDGSKARIRVAYQVRGPVEWRGENRALAGRTFEETFALENLAWSQDACRKGLMLNIGGGEAKSLQDMHEEIFKKVRNLAKTTFALGVMTERGENSGLEWRSPSYIVEGLQWLRDELVLDLPIAEGGIGQGGSG